MKIPYPDENFFTLRPCHVAMCFDCRPASKLLAILAYLSNPQDEEPTDVRISKSQAELVEAMLDEVTDKTLHDVASPFLQLLGFIDIEITHFGIDYIFHLGYFLQALALYVPKQKEQPQLEKVLIQHLQLEKFLIEWELEKVLNAIRKSSNSNKKKFQFLLEKVLILNRKSSNCQRGRKPRPQAASDGISETPKNREEYSKNREEEKEDTLAPVLSSGSHDGYTNHSEDTPAKKPLTIKPLLGLPFTDGSKTPTPQQIGATTHADTPVHSDLSRGDDRGGTGRDSDSLAHRLAPTPQTPVAARTGGISPPTDATVLPTQAISEPSASGDMQAADAPPVTTPSGSASEGAGTSGHQTALFGQEEQKTGKGKRGKKDGDGTQGEKPSPPPMPSEDAPWNTNTCKQLFDYWRKKPLLSTYQLGESSKLAKALAQNYTRAQVENSRNYMHDEAEWWSEHPEKVDIFSVAKHIHEMLEKMEQKIKHKGTMNGNSKPLQHDFSNGLNYFKPDDFAPKSRTVH